MAKTTRLQNRQARLRRRVMEAPTPALRLNASFDWFRCSAEYLAKTGARTGGQGPRYSLSARIVAEVSDYLAERAAEVDAYCSEGDSW
jgi:hypothetical protein